MPVDDHDQSTAGQQEFEQSRALISVGGQELVPVTSKDVQVLLEPDLSDERKVDIVLNFATYNPASTYNFPSKVEHGKNHTFQYHYLTSFAWLGYSVQLDGCLCLPCCLFCSSSDQIEYFVHKPFRNWTKLSDKVKSHFASHIHIRCVQALKSFKESLSGRQPTIDTACDSRRQQLYETNCQRLDAIIECVVLCGTQNIPFRGHSDANTSVAHNKGNFKAILEYRALGDQLLHKHLTLGDKNAQYTSPDTQNEILKICQSHILDKIENEVRENALYSVICDECTDCANQEQLSVSVRYVANDKVKEPFIGFFELSDGVTGESIAVTIEKALGSCHLDLSLLRGQAYDGASNMAGKYRGWAALIQNKHHRALYSHCCSHALNLAVVSSCSLVIVQNLFSVMNKVYKFFDNHPKRQYALNECFSMKVKPIQKQLIAVQKVRVQVKQS